jgi:hypothetical protein
MKMGGQAVADHLKSQEPKVLAGYALFIAAVIGFILLRRLVLSQLICYADKKGQESDKLVFISEPLADHEAVPRPKL